MTWEDDLYREENRLRAVEMQTDEGLELVEYNLRLLEKNLSELESIRANVTKDEYAKCKALILETRQTNLEQREQFYAARDEIERTRQELQQAWMKHEELRYNTE